MFITSPEEILHERVNTAIKSGHPLPLPTDAKYVEIPLGQIPFEREVELLGETVIPTFQHLWRHKLRTLGSAGADFIKSPFRYEYKDPQGKTKVEYAYSASDGGLLVLGALALLNGRPIEAIANVIAAALPVPGLLIREPMIQNLELRYEEVFSKPSSHAAPSMPRSAPDNVYDLGGGVKMRYSAGEPTDTTDTKKADVPPKKENPKASPTRDAIVQFFASQLTKELSKRFPDWLNNPFTPPSA